ncbi:MAG: chromate transporter [Anaerolineales bacterium]|nr:chromate transporter [Anaerolineales bacterium]
MDILSQLFWTFIKVNLLNTPGGFRGLLYHEAIGRFVTESQFIQAVGFSSVLPGSDALQLAMYIGYALPAFRRIGGFTRIHIAAHAYHSRCNHDPPSPAT